VLQYHFNWKTISVAAGMTWWNFYFQIFEKSIGKEEVVEFLMHLLQHLSGPLLIIWDRLPAHRSRLVAEFVRCLEGEIEIEYLPAYAPELNPVEYLWGHWKHHELPNVCLSDVPEEFSPGLNVQEALPVHNVPMLKPRERRYRRHRSAGSHVLDCR
jgi:transposase